MNTIRKSLSPDERRDAAVRDVYLYTGGNGPVGGLGPLCRELGYPKEAANITPLYAHIEQRGYGTTDGVKHGKKLYWGAVPGEWKLALARGERPSGGEQALQPADPGSEAESPQDPEVPKGEDLGPRQRQEARREESRVAHGGAVNRVLEREAEALAEAAIAPYASVLERAFKKLPRRARMLLAVTVLRLVETAEVDDPN